VLPRDSAGVQLLKQGGLPSQEGGRAKVSSLIGSGTALYIWMLVSV